MQRKRDDFLLVVFYLAEYFVRFASYAFGDKGKLKHDYKGNWQEKCNGVPNFETDDVVD